MSRNNKNEASNWEEIKNFVGGAKKQPKHPLVQEMDRMKQRQPEHFDEGGQVNDIPANFPNVPPGTMPLSMGQPTPSIPTPPPPNLSNPEQPYNDKASQILGGLDPAKISQLLENLRQQSNKSQVGAGIAGIGDAIASVGGQNPGHLKSAEESIRGNYDRGLKAPELMANAGKERFNLSQQLQENDPNSPAAQHARDTYGPLAKRMGLDISHASLKFIGDLVGKTVDQLKNESQESEAKAIHEQTAAYQGESLANQKQQIENTKQEHDIGMKQGAAEALDKRGMLQKVVDTIHPSASTKFLQGQVSGQGNTVRIQDSTGQMHDIPAQNLEKAKQRDPGLKVIQ